MTAPSRLTWKTWSQEVHTVALDFEKPGDIAAELYRPLAPRMTITLTSGSSSMPPMIAAMRECVKLIVFMGGRSKIR